jgi:FlaA1/EpsC-like NDP-sugar epimerase
MSSPFAGKRVLVTGACGTIGSELIRQLLSEEHTEVRSVVGLDNNESAVYFLASRYSAAVHAKFYVADICDRDSLTGRFRDVDIVFHTAALKHVILSEDAPDQTVRTNIIGTQNVIAAATENQVSRVLFTSSDKAVNPTSVMGTSKLIGEKLMTAADASYRRSGLIFASTRFGNVLGSNGSVVPIFRKQILAGGPVTITDRGMSRFVMSCADAARLVIDSIFSAIGGEVFITKMPVLRITDLAQAMIEELVGTDGSVGKGIQTDIIGAKPGEKLYEELMNVEESRRAVDLGRYFVILPPFRTDDPRRDRLRPQTISGGTDGYISANQPWMTVEEIRALLREHQLLSATG